MPTGWLQKLDSNQRLQGYEPCELPLLYSAKGDRFSRSRSREMKKFVEQKKGDTEIRQGDSATFVFA